MATKKKADNEEAKKIVIKAPNFNIFTTEIVGTTPYVGCRFSQKTKEQMMQIQKRGSEAKSTRNREPKDFDALYHGATHKSPEGWHGIPASALRNAMISACRVTGAVMTRAKLTVFVMEDGYDDEDPLTGLIKITSGEPERMDSYVRLADGSADIRPRPMWRPGWRATVRIRYDADQMSAETVSNLLMRAGQQVGLGEGRPDSKKSNGMGWGLFDLAKGPSTIGGNGKKPGRKSRKEKVSA